MKHVADWYGKRVTLVAFGDSNTEFNHWSFGRNWVSMLACNISNRFERAVVINSGRSGDTLENALDRLEEDVIAFHPGIVITAFGSNDALAGRGVSSFRQDYRQLLERLLEHDIAVVARTANPVVNMADGSEDVEFCPDYECYMEAVAAAAGEFGIPCVDHYHLWQHSMKAMHRGEIVMLMGNRLHPNEHGHRRFYHELAPELGLEPDFQCEFTHLLRKESELC